LVARYASEVNFVGEVEAKVEVTYKFGKAEIVALKISVKTNALIIFNGFLPNNNGTNNVLILGQNYTGYIQLSR
jgi:hypothetical protein